MVRAGRRLAAALASAVLVLAGTAMTAPPATASSPAALEVELARLVNSLRSQHGLPPLRTDVRLVAGARSWSGHMAATGDFRHDPDLQRTLPAGTSASAENVGWTSATSDLARRLHDMFAGSAPHRANLLDPRFTDIGIGIAAGGGRTYVTQRLTAGAPARVAAAVDTTARLAEQHFGPGRAAHAVVVRDDIYADALAAGPLAGRAGPLLLTPPGPALQPTVRLALEQTLPRGSVVWVAGGTAAVSSAVEEELRTAGWVPRRLSGRNRFETAVAVALTLLERDGRPEEVLVATGAGWADAAAGGAYGARAQAPVLLALHSSVPPETGDALERLRPDQVTVLGGTAVVSDAIVHRLGAQRVSSATRQGTSAAVARDLWGYSGQGPARWTAVPGFGDDAWTWALGVAPLAARQQAPVLLVGPELSPIMRDYLASLGYGGDTTAELRTHGPVPAASADQLRALLR